MKRITNQPRAGLLALAALIGGVLTVPGAGAAPAPPAAPAQTSAPWMFQFVYTTHAGRHAGADLWLGRYLVVGGRLTMRAAEPLARVTGADGVLRLGDGRLLVQATGGRLLLLERGATRVIRAWGVPGARRTVLDPNGRRAWVLGRPGQITELALDRAGPERTDALSGPDRDLVSVAFDRAGHAYYLAADGDVGTLDLSRYTTQRLTRIPSARSMVFDPFSGDLVLVGDGQLVRIDPRAANVASAVTLNPAVATAVATHAGRPAACGPASTDRRGTLLVACGRALAFVRAGADAAGVSVRWLSRPATSLAPTVVGRVDFGPYHKKRTCRPHHCTLTLPTFTG